MVRHKREGKNYVIKKVKTRDMNPKDLENTENEVSGFLSFSSYVKLQITLSSGEAVTKDKTHKYCRI